MTTNPTHEENKSKILTLEITGDNNGKCFLSENKGSAFLAFTDDQGKRHEMYITMHTILNAIKDSIIKADFINPETKENLFGFLSQ